jgi:hypothetical protein
MSHCAHLPHLFVATESSCLQTAILARKSSGSGEASSERDLRQQSGRRPLPVARCVQIPTIRQTLWALVGPLAAGESLGISQVLILGRVCRAKLKADLCQSRHWFQLQTAFSMSPHAGRNADDGRLF